MSILPPGIILASLSYTDFIITLNVSNVQGPLMKDLYQLIIMKGIKLNSVTPLPLRA